jgi:antitoxin ParD1/3/4
MNISLTPELNSYIQEKVKSGMYHSASEVVREGLRLLKERDAVQELRLQELRKQIQEGFTQIERGEYVEFGSTEALVEHITQKGRKRVAQKQAK